MTILINITLSQTLEAQMKDHLVATNEQKIEQKGQQIREWKKFASEIWWEDLDNNNKICDTNEQNEMKGET